ncbi:hypothetical protein CROQUDRAFT_655980 [Cronartium quercuum f. sp. fusiforme G11]|uniref:Uncharacterized protein n=1 Tax=Cronartium quercuum f. sp. fusiforme G11 TaxID=708437 RepID=A0A9P6TDB0_9BASI|nr:hypothetical protein CROQUDRAFT_655980 [Cronartium quercuum f. sp. fusiforme G11]
MNDLIPKSRSSKNLAQLKNLTKSVMRRNRAEFSGLFSDIIISGRKQFFKGCKDLMTCLGPKSIGKEEDQARLSRGRFRLPPLVSPSTSRASFPQASPVDDMQWLELSTTAEVSSLLERFNLAVFRLSDVLSTAPVPKDPNRVVAEILHARFEQDQTSEIERMMISMIYDVAFMRSEKMDMNEIVSVHRAKAYHFFKEFELESNAKRREDLSGILKSVQAELEHENEKEETRRAEEIEMWKEWDMRSKAIINRMRWLIGSIRASQGEDKTTLESEISQLKARAVDARMFDYFYQLTEKLMDHPQTVEKVYKETRDDFLEAYRKKDAILNKASMIHHTSLLDLDLIRMFQEVEHLPEERIFAIDMTPKDDKVLKEELKPIEVDISGFAPLHKLAISRKNSMQSDRSKPGDV